MSILSLCRGRSIKLRKSIIVTGASSGIGKATVIKLVDSGYQVFGLARSYNKLALNLANSSSGTSSGEIGLFSQMNLTLLSQKYLTILFPR